MAKKTKRKATKARGDQKTTEAKQKFVGELIKSDPKITMSAAGKKVTEKFGTMLAFAKLREAFTSGGGKLTGRGRKSKQNSKVASKSKTQLASNPARSVGRRSDDKRAASLDKTLSGMPTFMVVALEGSKSVPNVFATGKQAEDHVKKLLAQGMAPAHIGYYERKPMGVTVQI